MSEAMLAVGAMALVTFGTRALPFLALRGESRFLSALASLLPPAAMTILFLACFKDIPWGSGVAGIREAGCALVVALLHIWKRKALLSIFGGLALYMVAIRLG